MNVKEKKKKQETKADRPARKSVPVGYKKSPPADNRRARRKEELRTGEKGSMGRTHRVIPSDERDKRLEGVKTKQRMYPKK